MNKQPFILGLVIGMLNIAVGVKFDNGLNSFVGGFLVSFYLLNLLQKDNV